MICPSDAFAGTAFNGYNVATTLGAQSNWGRGCYGANASVYWTSSQLNEVPANFTSSINGKGVMGLNLSLSMKQITDGTSKVVAAVELRADPSPSGARGVWGLTTGSSAIYACGATNCDTTTPSSSAFSDPGPNNPGNITGSQTSGDIVSGCNVGLTYAQEFALGMGCSQSNFNNMMGPKSQHPGGLLSVFCDGSVHWLDDGIQVGVTQSTNSLTTIVNGYWEMLFLSQDGANVPGDAYGAN
jgi:hypothetical protein